MFLNHGLLQEKVVILAQYAGNLRSMNMLMSNKCVINAWEMVK